MLRLSWIFGIHFCPVQLRKYYTSSGDTDSSYYRNTKVFTGFLPKRSVRGLPKKENVCSITSGMHCSCIGVGKLVRIGLLMSNSLPNPKIVLEHTRQRIYAVSSATFRHWVAQPKARTIPSPYHRENLCSFNGVTWIYATKISDSVPGSLGLLGPISFFVPVLGTPSSSTPETCLPYQCLPRSLHWSSLANANFPWWTETLCVCRSMRTWLQVLPFSSNHNV